MVRQLTLAILLVTAQPLAWLPANAQLVAPRSYTDNASSRTIPANAKEIGTTSEQPASKPTPTAADQNATKSADRPLRDKWALVVGISKFANPNVPKLKYSAKDAKDFRDYLVNEAHFAPDHVRVLLDDMATRRNVLSEVGNKFLARVAKPDDLVVLFFSTHGSPSQLDIRNKNFVVAYDSDPDDLYTTGIEMDNIVNSISSRVLCDRVMLVLDACHSGGADSNAKDLGRKGNFDPSVIAQGSGQLVICSSDKDQRSWESKRYANGVFTRKLIDGLRSRGDRTQLDEAFSFVKQAVSDEVQEDFAEKQTPEMVSKWNGSSLVIAALPIAPQPLPHAVNELLGPDSLQPRRVTPPTNTMKPAAMTGNWRAAIDMFKRGDLASAADILEAATKSGAAKEFDAHYTLANAYARLGKTDLALRAYKQAFALKTSGKEADYCLQMINYYSNAGNGRAYNTIPKGAYNSPPGTTVAPVYATATTNSAYGTRGDATRRSEYIADSDLIDPKRISETLPKLPRIEKWRPDPPTLTEITTEWTLRTRAEFASTAKARVYASQANLQRAEQMRRDALARATGFLVPNRPGFGEQNAQFQRRKAAYEAEILKLLVPYNEELGRRREDLDQQNAILQSCEQAQTEIYLKPPLR